jgi:hypothetical protein
MKYDVFISSKSEDYHLAEEVYDFLRSEGLSVFIASEELKKIGEAQYSDAIDDVLDHSIHMVVVASSVEHIKSKWVKYEWSTFSNDLKSGYRSGNLITILTTSIELKSLPASLRHQQSFQIENYKDEILDYLPVIRDIASSPIQEPLKDKEIIEIATVADIDPTLHKLVFGRGNMFIFINPYRIAFKERHLVNRLSHRIQAEEQACNKK